MQQRKIGVHPLTGEVFFFTKPKPAPRRPREKHEVRLACAGGHVTVDGSYITQKLPWKPSKWYVQHMRDQFKAAWK